MHQMATQFAVPTVTSDLLNFHSRVYGKPFAGALLDTPPSTLPPDKEYIEEDDGLGYYEDGNKRTLTDEQIAIFRHSEIQSLLRARRHARERRGSCFQGSPPSQEVHEVFQSLQAAEDKEAEEAGDEVVDDDEEEYARFLEAEQKEMKAMAARSRGKIGKDRKPGLGKASTRRIVREMDAVASTTTSLDYGDGASDPRVAGPVNTSARSDYQEDATDGQSSKGRKIRWPVLQGTDVSGPP